MTDNIVDPSQYAVNLELIDFSYKLSAVNSGLASPNRSLGYGRRLGD